MKQCPACQKTFIPSSRHNKCPACREKEYKAKFSINRKPEYFSDMERQYMDSIAKNGERELDPSDLSPELLGLLQSYVAYQKSVDQKPQDPQPSY